MEKEESLEVSRGLHLAYSPPPPSSSQQVSDLRIGETSKL